jgi:biotin carboxyl carrier protein
MELEVFVSGQKYKVTKNGVETRVNENLIDYELKKTGAHLYHIHAHNKIFEIEIQKVEDKKLKLKINGKSTTVSIKSHMDLVLEKLGMNVAGEYAIQQLNSPMPGSIIEILVEDGSEVKKGEPMIILEAMKMENVIKASVDVVVTKIYVNIGDNVEKNQPLIAF